MATLHYSGTLKSIVQPESFGWLAFDLQLKRAKGPMELVTAAGIYELEINLGSAKVRADGQPLGSLVTRAQKVHLLGIDEQPFGYYKRPSKAIKFYLGPNPDFFKPAYGSVVMNGRQVAEFNNNMVLIQHLKFMEDPMPTLYQNLVNDLTSEETDWLLALLAMEIYFRIERHLSDKGKRYR